jgi:hypothetical protein
MSRGGFCAAKNCDMKRTRLTRCALSEAPTSVFQQTCLPPSRFLIANLELDLHVSPIRISQLKFSNRKYFAIFRVALQTNAVPAPTSAASPSSIQRLSRSLLNLIQTPRLEFPATPTKQSPLADPNRDKNGLFWLAFHRDSYLRSTDNSLCDSVPPWSALTTTLTLLEPQSNLPASCFVRARVGEHSL